MNSREKDTKQTDQVSPRQTTVRAAIDSDEEPLFFTEEEIEAFLATRPQPSPERRAELQSFARDLVKRILRKQEPPQA